MLRLCLLFLLTAYPISALSQVVSVRSGEHENYSRLVFDFEAPVSWQLLRTSSGYLIDFQQSIQFDLSTIFVTMPRSRIADVIEAPRSQQVNLELNCDVCYANAFEIRQGVLVIDILDGEPPLTSQIDFANDEETNNLAPRVAIEVRGLPSPQSINDFPNAVLPRGWQYSLPLQARGLPKPPLSDDPKFALNRNASNRFVQVEGSVNTDSEDLLERRLQRSTSNLERQPAQTNIGSLDAFLSLAPSSQPNSSVSMIAEKLARAATQGLVTVEANDSEGMVSVSQTEPLQGPNNIRVRTSIERDNASVEMPLARDNARPQCPEPRLFDVALWGDPERLGSEISKYRGEVINEFDEPNALSVQSLAQHYIFLTFGAEAESVLNSYPGLIDNEPILRALSSIMEDEISELQHIFVEHADCNGMTALWAFLTNSDTFAAGTIPSNAILASFSALPLHLRRHLGPRLAEAFVSVGSEDLAREVMADIMRAPGRHGTNVELLATLIDPAMTSEELRPFIDSETESSAQAMIALVESRVSDGLKVSESDIQTLSTLAFELNGKAISKDLIAWKIRAISNNGETLRAIEVLLESLQGNAIRNNDLSILSQDILSDAEEGESVVGMAVALDSLVAALSVAEVTALEIEEIVQKAMRYGLLDLREVVERKQSVNLKNMIMAEIDYRLKSGELRGISEVFLQSPQINDLEQYAMLKSLNGQHVSAADLLLRLDNRELAQEELLLARNWPEFHENGDFLEASSQNENLVENIDSSVSRALVIANSVRSEISSLSSNYGLDLNLQSN